MLTLNNHYITHISDGRHLYGGNQTLMKNKRTRQCGCGVIAALDTLIYLHLYHDGCNCSDYAAIKNSYVPHDEYEKLAEKLQNKYLPLIPHFGTNGIMLAAGINAFMKKHNYPYKASYGTEKGQLFRAVERMISEDLPVILLIGASFPEVWVKDPLNLYVKFEDGTMKKACAVDGHFVCITGIDDEWLSVSSWGRQYFISREELIHHTKSHSIELFNTIIQLRPRKRT